MNTKTIIQSIVVAVAAATLTLQSSQGATHILTGTGADNWTTATWTGGVPNAPGEIASYGTPTATLALETLTLDAPQTVGAITNTNTGAWTITGANTLTLDGTGLATGTVYGNTFGVGASPAGSAFIGTTITNTAGALTVNTPISINSNLNVGALIGNSGAVNIGGAISNISGTARTVGFFDAGGPVNVTGDIGASGDAIAILITGNSSQTTTLSGNLGTSVTTVTSNSNNNGNLSLTGTNSYTGSTTLTLGKITAQDGATTSPGANNFIRALSTTQVNLNAGTLFLKANGSAGAQTIITGDGVTGNNVVLGGNTTIDVNRINGTNTGSTIQLNNLSIGANTLNVTSNNSYALQFAGTTTLTGNATFNPNGIFTLANAIGESSSGLGFSKTGAGTLVLNGNNTFTGGVTVNAGVVQLGNAGAFNSTTPNALTFGTSSTGTVRLNGNSVTVSSLNTGATVGTPNIQSGSAVAGADVLTVNNATADTYAGTLTNGTTRLLGVTKAGSGSLVLSGVNTYTGDTSVSSGTLRINGTLATTAVGVGGDLAANTPTLGGGIGSANGGVLGAVIGGATLQTYTASTTVGNLGGTVTVNGPGLGAAGHLAPGNSVGTLRTSSLTLNTGSILDYEFNGTANDFTFVANALTLGTGVGINLYTENTTNPLTAAGTYNLFGYGTFSGAASNLAVLNPQSGYIYTFNDDTADKIVQLTVAVPEPGTYAMAAGGLWLALGLRRFRRKA